MLHYEIVEGPGDAPWIVFVHGAGGSMKTWAYQQPAWEGKFNLLLIDLRDHGNSKLPGEAGTYSFELIARDIFEVLDKLQIERAIFMSLSFGSVLLQDLSLRRPGLVMGAIMAGGIFRANLLIRIYVHFARFLNLFLSYPRMYRLFSWLLMPGRNHQLSRRIYQHQARKLSGQAYMRWIGLYSEFFSLLNRFSRQSVTFPTLVVMGSQDHIFLSSARAFVKKQQEHVQLAVITGAGHICTIDEPEKFNRLADQFISDEILLSEASC